MCWTSSAFLQGHLSRAYIRFNDWELSCRLRLVSRRGCPRQVHFACYFTPLSILATSSVARGTSLAPQRQCPPDRTCGSVFQSERSVSAWSRNSGSYSLRMSGSIVYPKVIQPGFHMIYERLPVAQKMVFGWIFSGGMFRPNVKWIWTIAPLSHCTALPVHCSESGALPLCSHLPAVKSLLRTGAHSLLRLKLVLSLSPMNKPQSLPRLFSQTKVTARVHSKMLCYEMENFY